LFSIIPFKKKRDCPYCHPYTHDSSLASLIPGHKSLYHQEKVRKIRLEK
jgi:hypothetical protein